jgi:serine/threonine-protein kinase HipA
VIGDDLGELRVAASSPRQRFLEAFRLRSEHASAVTAEMRVQMAARLLQEHGTPRAAADAVWALARENEWYREGEGAERFLLAQPGAAKVPVNKAALDLLVAWHGEPLGRLIHDGFEWRWKAQRRTGPALVRETASALRFRSRSVTPADGSQSLQNARAVHQRDGHPSASKTATGSR